MDSPAGPVGPVIDAPVGPVGPVIDAPVGPVGPVIDSPAGPVGPVGPTAPLDTIAKKTCSLFAKPVVPVPFEVKSETGI